MSNARDYHFMARAMQLARRGLFTTHPNPSVGCVVVKEERAIGEGFHARAGQPHAEVNALREAGAAARGATAYVTLEPCCHQGRTPACTQALIQGGIKRVVAAMVDPNPQVAGKGLAALAAAGIKTTVGVMEAQARVLNCGFVSRMQRGRPWVRIKLAMSLDGRTALASGESRWISGEAARKEVQYLRARSSAILTGSGTVRADDPALTLRLTAADLGVDAPLSQPTRVILNTNLTIDPRAQILEPPGRCIIFAAAGAPDKIERLERPNVEVMLVRSHGPMLDLSDVMQTLGRLEFNEVQVEAGATLTGALLEKGLADELVIYMAPLLMGDAARGLAHLPQIAHMTDRLRLEIEDVRMIGDDLRVTARPTANGS